MKGIGEKDNEYEIKTGNWEYENYEKQSSSSAEGKEVAQLWESKYRMCKNRHNCEADMLRFAEGSGKFIVHTKASITKMTTEYAYSSLFVVLAVGRCLSVCLSVVLVYCIGMA